MRSIEMCEAKLATIDQDIERAKARRDAWIDSVTQQANATCQVRVSELEGLRQAIQQDLTRLRERAVKVATPIEGPYTLQRADGAWLKADGHFDTWARQTGPSPYLSRESVKRYRYRSSADYDANVHDARVRTWREFEQSEFARPEAPADLGPKPQMPDTDPYMDKAGWDAYQAASLEWERKKFEGDAK